MSIMSWIKTGLRGPYRMLLVLRKAFILDYSSYFRKKGVEVGKECKFIVAPYFWNIPDMGSEPYLIQIGDHTTVSFGTTFLTHDGSNWVFRENWEYQEVIIAGRIIIGNNCFIGCKSTILPGVVIGDNCIIGACSLVTKSVPDGEVWGGVPAHFITTTKEFAEKCKNQSPPHEPITKRNKKEVLKSLYLERNS